MLYDVEFADLQQYRDQGYVILRGLLSQDIAATLLERADGMLEGRYPSAGFKCGAASEESDDDPGRLIRQIMPMDFPIRDPVLFAYAELELLMQVAAQLMGVSEAAVFQQQVLVKEPGAANATPWHQDDFYWGLGKKGRQGITAWMPLLPACRETGTMWLLPESHRGATLPHEKAGAVSKFHTITVAIDETRLIPLDLDPGDVSFHHRNLIHGSYANSGTRRRVAIAQHYHDV